MRMAKVNPLNAKYCVDFTFANLSPSLNSHEFSKNGPPKIKAIYLLATKKAKSFHIMPNFLLVSYISLYLKGTEIAKVKSEV